MKSVRFEQDSAMWKFFRDYYKFVQTFSEIDEENELQYMIDEINVILNRYTNQVDEQYLRDMLMAHLNQVERKYKNGKQ